MDTKEKCEEIISILGGKKICGANETLLVKFADGGGKKKHYKNDGRGYRNDMDVSSCDHFLFRRSGFQCFSPSQQLQMYDSTNMATNGGGMSAAQLLPSPMNGAAAFRAYNNYQNQAAQQWMVAHQAGQHPGAGGGVGGGHHPHYALMQHPHHHHQMMAGMDPSGGAAALAGQLQFNPLMHQLTAQMSHMAVSGQGVSTELDV